MSVRGSGRTSRQIAHAPRDALYVWCNNDTSYPQTIAVSLGRNDITFCTFGAIERGGNDLRGIKFSEIIVDHAASLTQNMWLVVDALNVSSWRNPPEPASRTDKPKFWVVWCPSKGTPNARHHTYKTAQDEAAQLARANPGNGYFVLEAQTLTVMPMAVAPTVTKLGDDDDEVLC